MMAVWTWEVGTSYEYTPFFKDLLFLAILKIAACNKIDRK